MQNPIAMVSVKTNDKQDFTANAPARTIILTVLDKCHSDMGHGQMRIMPEW
jgi:hypothetical protein